VVSLYLRSTREKEALFIIVIFLSVAATLFLKNLVNLEGLLFGVLPLFFFPFKFPEGPSAPYASSFLFFGKRFGSMGFLSDFPTDGLLSSNPN
jgi:hypothetical protein